MENYILGCAFMVIGHIYLVNKDLGMAIIMFGLFILCSIVHFYTEFKKIR